MRRLKIGHLVLQFTEKYAGIDPMLMTKAAGKRSMRGQFDQPELRLPPRKLGKAMTSLGEWEDALLQNSPWSWAWN